MVRVMLPRFKVNVFLCANMSSIIGVESSFESIIYIETVGSDIFPICRAIDIGEKAWQESGRKLNYRVETMDDEIVLVRYADMNYATCDLEDFFEIVARKMESFDYIHEYFNN